MIFETHAHYDDSQFSEDRREILERMKDARIERIINIGASIDSTKSSIELAKAYDFIYAAVGVHPSDVSDLNEESFAWLKEQTQLDKVVAIGEIGLDYYWDKEALVQEKQRYWFGRQLELARETGLPVVIHSRDAAADTLSVMREHKAEELTGVVHCYSYSKELAKEFLDMGYYFGIGGVITFKNAKKLVETVEWLPLDKILLETDSPYLTPEPNRGKRNCSLYLPYVVEKIAQIKGISAEEVEKITEENAFRLFTKIA